MMFYANYTSINLEKKFYNMQNYIVLLHIILFRYIYIYIYYIQQMILHSCKTIVYILYGMYGCKTKS